MPIPSHVGSEASSASQPLAASELPPPAPLGSQLLIKPNNRTSTPLVLRPLPPPALPIYTTAETTVSKEKYIKDTFQDFGTYIPLFKEEIVHISELVPFVSPEKKEPEAIEPIRSSTKSKNNHAYSPSRLLRFIEQIEQVPTLYRPQQLRSAINILNPTSIEHKPISEPEDTNELYLNNLMNGHRNVPESRKEPELDLNHGPIILSFNRDEDVTKPTEIEDALLAAYQTSRDDITKVDILEKETEELETQRPTIVQQKDARQRLEQARKAAEMSEQSRINVLATFNETYKTSINEFITQLNQRLAMFTSKLNPMLTLFYSVSKQPRGIDPKQFMYTIPSLVNFPVNNQKVDSTIETLYYYLKHYEALIIYIDNVVKLDEKIDKLLQGYSSDLSEYSKDMITGIQQVFTQMNERMRSELTNMEPYNQKDVRFLVKQLKNKTSILKGLLDRFNEMKITPWEQRILAKFGLSSFPKETIHDIHLLRKTEMGARTHGGEQGVFRIFVSLQQTRHSSQFVYNPPSHSRGTSLNRPPVNMSIHPTSISHIRGTSLNRTINPLYTVSSLVAKEPSIASGQVNRKAKFPQPRKINRQPVPILEFKAVPPVPRAATPIGLRKISEQNYTSNPFYERSYSARRRRGSARNSVTNTSLG